ncbi:MAG: hypothetical protein PHT41_05675 [Candidatus Omnitrophica bacterium]|nr:hypothetical protein [Candidatus Omnitrophota bacterium]
MGTVARYLLAETDPTLKASYDKIDGDSKSTGEKEEKGIPDFGLVANAAGEWHVYGDGLKVFRPYGEDGQSKVLDSWEKRALSRAVDLQADGSTAFTTGGGEKREQVELNSAVVEDFWSDKHAAEVVMTPAEFDKLTTLQTKDEKGNVVKEEKIKLRDENNFHFGRNMLVDDIGPGALFFVLPKDRGPSFHIGFYNVGEDGLKEQRKFWVENPIENQILRFIIGNQTLTDFNVLDRQNLGLRNALFNQDYQVWNHWLIVGKYEKALYLVQGLLDQVAGQKDFNPDALVASIQSTLSEAKVKISDENLKLLIAQAKDILEGKHQGDDIKNAIISLAYTFASLSGKQGLLDQDIFINLQPAELGIGAALLTPGVINGGKEELLKTYKVDVIDQDGNPIIKENMPFPWLSAPLPAGKESAMNNLGNNEQPGERGKIPGRDSIGFVKDTQGKAFDNPFFAEHRTDRAVIPLLNINTIFNLTNYKIVEDGAYFGWGGGILRKWSEGSTVDFKSYADKDGKTQWIPLVDGKFAPVFSNEFAIVKNADGRTFFDVLYKADAWWEGSVKKEKDRNGKEAPAQSYRPLSAKDGKELAKGESLLSHLTVSDFYGVNGSKVGNFVTNPQTSYWHPQAGLVLSFNITDPEYNYVLVAKQSSEGGASAANPVADTIENKEISIALAHSVLIRDASVTNDDVKIKVGEEERSYRQLTGSVLRDAVLLQPFYNIALPAGFSANTAVGMKAGIMAPDKTGNRTIPLGTGKGILMLNDNFGVYQGNVFFEDSKFLVGLGARTVLEDKDKEGKLVNFFALRHGYTGNDQHDLNVAYHYNKETIKADGSVTKADKTEANTYFRQFEESAPGLLRTTWQKQKGKDTEGKEVEIEQPIREVYIPLGDNKFYIKVDSEDAKGLSAFIAERLSASNKTIKVGEKEYYAFKGSTAIGIDDQQSYTGNFWKVPAEKPENANETPAEIKKEDATDASAYTDIDTGWTHYQGKLALTLNSPFSVGVTPEGATSVNFNNAQLKTPEGQKLVGEMDKEGQRDIVTITPLNKTGTVSFDDKGQMSVTDAQLSYKNSSVREQFKDLEDGKRVFTFTNGDFSRTIIFNKEGKPESQEVLFEGKKLTFVAGEGKLAIDSQGRVWNLEEGKQVSLDLPQVQNQVQSLNQKYSEAIENNRTLAQDPLVASYLPQDYDIAKDEDFRILQAAIDQARNQVLENNRKLAQDPVVAAGLPKDYDITKDEDFRILQAAIDQARNQVLENNRKLIQDPAIAKFLDPNYNLEKDAESGFSGLRNAIEKVHAEALERYAQVAKEPSVSRHLPEGYDIAKDEDFVTLRGALSKARIDSLAKFISELESHKADSVAGSVPSGNEL